MVLHELMCLNEMSEELTAWELMETCMWGLPRLPPFEGAVGIAHGGPC